MHSERVLVHSCNFHWLVLLRLHGHLKEIPVAA